MNEEQALKLLRLTDNPSTTAIVELVAMFLQNNVDEELSPETVKTRKTHLNQFARFCTSIHLSDITLLNNAFLEQYFVHYRETHSKSTTNTDKRIVKVFLTWVREYKELNIRAVPETIKSRKDKDKKRKHLDRSLIEKVISECPDEQDRLIIAVFAEAGLRVSELTGLQVSDVRGDELDIHGKGEIDRTVPITDGLAAALGRFIADTKRAPEDFLFQNTRVGTAPLMDNDAVRRHIRKWFKRIAGLDVTPHQLRHSYAVILLLGGTNLVTIQKLLGHADINTTMVYLRITDLESKLEYKAHIGRSLLT